MPTVDLNCDMGESFGNYTIGNDERVMPYITSANIAAGYHAGDPHVMRETVSLATEHDVDLGVHPGLPDMIGYGRREMDVTPQELHDYIVYQLGALQAFATQAGKSVGHVKPHGVIVRLLADEEYAHAVMDGIHAVDEDLIFIAPDVTLYEHAKNHPIPAVMDGYVDMLYRPDRTLIIEQKKTEHDPADVADRFVSIATEGTVEAVNGDMIDIPAKSICIHGDNPNVVELLDEIYSRLDDHGIELAGLDAVV